MQGPCEEQEWETLDRKGGSEAREMGAESGVGFENLYKEKSSPPRSPPLSNLSPTLQETGTLFLNKMNQESLRVGGQ